MIAVVVVRAGALPAGAAETIAECGGRALLIGSGATEAAGDLTGVASTITVVERDEFHPAEWTFALAPLLRDEPAVVLPASADGRDLAPRLAARLHRPLYAGATLITAERVDLARKGGTELHSLTPAPQYVATLQPGVRGVVPTDRPAPAVHTVAVPLTEDCRDATVTAVQPPDPATIDLAEAPRIVAGGAGLDGPSRLEQLTRVGSAIGASLGATRVITDRGWVPHARQIGTTGVIVDPELYVAFGVSGAVQHTTGLGDPDHIITVNTDPHCPMMQLSDLAIVADANATLDQLVDLLERDPA